MADAKGISYEDSCLGKEKFQSGHIAYRVARKRARKGVITQTYRCNYCGQYHLGSSTKSKFKRPRRI